MSETVKIWIENYKTSGVSLSEEIDETKTALDNENTWLLGSDTEESINAHSENIENLLEYLEWLQKDVA